MRVEVAFALPARQWLREIEVEPGTTAAEAVRQSGLLAVRPEIDPERTALGIFGESCAPGTVLRPGDRVEVYRALRADPKVARRRRARARSIK